MIGSFSEIPELLAAQIVFLIALPLVVFVPVRWAVLVWLILGNFDCTGPSRETASSFGWLNAAKGVGIPLLLLWRLKAVQSTALLTLPARLWMALTSYACIASLWSPFPLAAIKLVGNMCGILLAIVVLEKAARRRLLDTHVLVIFAVATMSLGAVQTYYFGGKLYGYDGPDQPIRFSSFVFSQQYAAILVAFLAAVLWQPFLHRWPRLVLASGICLALALNGSRTWFLGAVIVIAIYLWVHFKRVVAVTAFGSASACAGALLVLNLSPWGASASTEAPSRIMATVNAILSGEDSPDRAGLRDLSFRFIVYNEAMEELQAGSIYDIVFGHGSSSGAIVSLRIFPDVYNADFLDANRTIHNEWLRALFEWGIIGLGLLIGVFVSLVAGVLVLVRRNRRHLPSRALMSFLPAFLIALSTENVLAGAGNAVTLGLALLIGLLWSTRPQESYERGNLEARLLTKDGAACQV